MRSLAVAMAVALAVAMAVAVAVGVVGTAVTAPPLGAAPHHGPSHTRPDVRSPLVKSAHVPLGSCVAKDVLLQATVPRLAYAASQSVTVAVVVHNVGSRTCTYGGTGGRYPEYMGPCGAFPLQVESRGGAPLWPGPVAYSCPAISATPLAPGAKVTATGTWPKAIVTKSSSSGAPAGTYRLVVDQRITFTISLR
jgi:hypothetical protein